MRKVIQNTVLLILAVVTIFLVFEFVFRLLGYKAYLPASEQMKGTRMEPKPLFNPDSVIGYKLDSGTYKIFYEDGNYWQTTNNGHGYRITSRDTITGNLSRQIDILGCSFTYGTGLADSQTYPYLLQQKLKSYRVNNFAVPGHGMAQNFVRLTQQIQIDSGDVVIYAYIAGHDFKTNHANRKKMYPSRNLLKKYYYLYLTEDLNVVRTPYDYYPWPLIAHSAFINFLEDRYLAILDDTKAKHRASKVAISYMNKLCAKHGANFIFIILDSDEASLDMINYCGRNNISCLALKVDIQQPRYNLLPYDEHPNYAANKLYAQQLYDFLLVQHLISE